MNKLQMAHEYALKMLENLNPMQLDKPTRDGIAYECFELADAMQAEADKRLKADVVTADSSDWQPDWSQAPDGYKWWAFDGYIKGANWYNLKPWIDDYSEVEDEWNADLGSFLIAPSFGYKGDWKDSLRKRP